MERLLVINRHQKDTCYDEIGVYPRNVNTMQGSTVNTMEGSMPYVGSMTVSSLSISQPDFEAYETWYYNFYDLQLFTGRNSS